MSTPSRVFVARLAGLSVFDPHGDQVGRVRDIVIAFHGARRPTAHGLVVEVPGRRRVFLPMTRVTSVEGGQVSTTGLVNMSRFEPRHHEALALGELLERVVTVRLGDGPVECVVEDIGIEQQRNRDWVVAKVFVRKGPVRTSLSRFARRRGEAITVPIEDVTGLREPEAAEQSAHKLLEAYDDLKPADLAEVIHDLTPKRRAEVAAAMDDERLADVLEELPEDDQVQILATLENARAADVLEAMEPDDATDLLRELPPEQAEQLLQLMQEDEAEDIRRLLTYDDNTAGGLMTPEPIILGPDASIAEALAVVRREEISPALAAAVFVCRPPLETPTGRYLGMVHIQRLLREPPHAPIGGILDKDIDPLPPEALLGRVTRSMAIYNHVSVPITDPDGRLLGAVTVDDVLDHILPPDWRDERSAPRPASPQVSRG